MIVLDPLVHGSLVVVGVWLVNLLLSALNINLGGDVVTQLVTLLVGYILSLLGYEVYARATDGVRGNVLANNPRVYRPPFTS